jgi:predicted transcriptional regulator
MKEKMLENLEKEYLEMTMPEIAQKYGLTKRMVQYYIEKYGLSKYSKLTDPERKMLVAEYKPRQNNSELAAKLSMTENALSWAYKRIKSKGC